MYVLYRATCISVICFKALSWCPWRCGQIASGGGTADKTLHLWNTATGKVKQTIRTNSQVSGIIVRMHKESSIINNRNKLMDQLENDNYTKNNSFYF